MQGFLQENALGVTLEDKVRRKHKRQEARDPKLAKIRALFANVDKDGSGPSRVSLGLCGAHS